MVPCTGVVGVVARRAVKRATSAGRKVTGGKGRAWGNALGGYKTQARQGGKFASGNGGAKVKAQKARRAAGRAYVKGSARDELHVGVLPGGYKGVSAGARYRTPAGRGVVVRASVGYRGKPDRRLDVTPSLDKPTKTLTVKVKPNPGRKPTAARSARDEPGRKVKQ